MVAVLPIRKEYLDFPLPLLGQLLSHGLRLCLLAVALKRPHHLNIGHPQLRDQRAKVKCLIANQSVGALIGKALIKNSSDRMTFRYYRPFWR